MTIVDERGEKVDFSLKDRIVDWILDHRTVIGNKRWGIVQLYYRAGLSQRQIADILGVTRQAVTHEMRRAFGMVMAYEAAREKTQPRQQRVDSPHE